MELIQQKRNEYTEYIDEHVKNVKKAWGEVQNKCHNIIVNLFNGYISTPMYMITNDIKLHDQSKYSEYEFEAYRKNFFPISDEEKENNKEDFDKAWEHHYMNNPHHWDYWWHRYQPMPTIFIIEMVCDWQAMGYKFGNNSLEYYNNNRDKIKFHNDEQARETLEKMLHALCD